MTTDCLKAAYLSEMTRYTYLYPIKILEMLLEADKMYHVAK